MFGELGLFMKAPRAATILAVEDCDFAILGADDYREILLLVDAKKAEDRINFFKEYMLMKCGRHIINKFSYNFKKVKYRRGQIVY
jgi:hypothetical protein